MGKFLRGWRWDASLLEMLTDPWLMLTSSDGNTVQASSAGSMAVAATSDVCWARN